MKKKLLSLLLALCLVFGSIQTLPAVSAFAESKEVLPQKGEVFSGFKVTNLSYDSATKSDQIQLTHEKSGAKMLVLKNDSTNRGFAIGFNTPAENDKGINHILEHSILGGSEKYPSGNMIFDLMNTTYTSFVNAFTYQNMTMYPVCSESETQLMKLTDIYMDSVYHPLIAKNEKVFQREAWRYEMEDAKSPITVNGIVYNEMRGNYDNIKTAAYYNSQKSIFPDINQGNVSGGNPDAILNLSYDEFLKTYQANYHPSNSFMILYGDVNYKEFLKMLDENYLSSYNKKTFDIKHTEQKKFTKLVEKNYSFPASKTANTKNQSIIDLVFATTDLKKLGIENYVGLALVSNLLNVDTSSFKQALTNSGIAQSYSVSVGADTYQPSIHFIATNADPAKSKQFYNLVMKELKNTVKTGVNQELIQSILASMKFNNVLGTEGNTPQNAMAAACLYNNIFDNPTINITDYYSTISKKLSSHYLENLIDKYIIKNTHAALVTTTPKAGLLEKNNAAFAKKLAAKKTSMSQKELNTLIKSSKDFNDWNSQPTPKEVLASMKAISAKDLPVEVKKYSVQDSSSDGFRQITATADVSEVGNIGLVFNEKHLDKDELLYLKFYADLICNISPTKNYTEEQLLNAIVSKTNSFGISMNVYANEQNKDDVYPAFSVSLNSLDSDYKENMAMIKDMLLNTSLDQFTAYAERTINYTKSNYSQMFANPISLILMRSFAYASPQNELNNYLNGLDYYNFVLSLEKELKLNPDKVINKIESVRSKAFSKKDFTSLFAGNQSSQKLYAETLPIFTENLSEETHTAAVYTFSLPAKHEALTSNTTVQYLSLNSALNANGMSANGKYNVISNLLTNTLLIPEIRLKGGAYGAQAGFSENNYYAYTFRDNNFVTSLETINSSGSFLRKLSESITQDDLDSYIISTFAAANISTSELNGAAASMYNKMKNQSEESQIRLLTEIKSTTLQDLKNASAQIDQLNKNSNYIVVASPELIEQNKDLFDSIIPLGN